MSDEYIQTIAKRAGELATQAAMNGRPAQVIWIPPSSGTSNFYGNFAVVENPQRSASTPDPWVTKGI